MSNGWIIRVVLIKNVLYKMSKNFLKPYEPLGGDIMLIGFIYCLKKLMKDKRGFGKTCHFFSLNSLFLMFGIFQIVLRLIGSLLDHFDPQET